MVASLGLIIPREGLFFVLLTIALTMSSSFFLALSATQLRHQPRGPCYPAPELRPLAIGIADLQPFFAGAARPSSPLRTPGTDWHPKQSAGGMQFLCVAHTCDHSSGDRLPPDRSASIPSSPLHLGDGRWEITLAAHTLYLRKRMGASVGLTEGCASVLLPGGYGDCPVWDDGALNIPFTTPARTVVTGGEPYISSVHLWLRFLPVRDVLRLSQLNMSWRDGMPLILSVRDDLLYLWERANSPLVATWSSSQVLSQLHKIVDEILDELSGYTFENTSIASDVCSDGCSSEDGDEAHWRRLSELDAATLFGPGYDFDDLTHGGSLPQVKRPGYASRHGRGRRSLAREEESGDDDSLFDEQEGELHHYAARLAGGP